MPDMALFRKKKYVCPHCSGALIVHIESTENSPYSWYSWAECECGARTPKCKADKRADSIDMLHECICRDEVYKDFPICPYCGESNTITRGICDDDVQLHGFHVVCKYCGASSPIKSSSKEAVSVALVLSEKLEAISDHN